MASALGSGVEPAAVPLATRDEHHFSAHWAGPPPTAWVCDHLSALSSPDEHSITDLPVGRRHDPERTCRFVRAAHRERASILQLRPREAPTSPYLFILERRSPLSATGYQRVVREHYLERNVLRLALLAIRLQDPIAQHTVFEACGRQLSPHAVSATFAARITVTRISCELNSADTLFVSIESALRQTCANLRR
jgi:hypothetical protein